MNRILVVCAHPDDEILGVGGTIARLVKEGIEAHTLILGEGGRRSENDIAYIEQLTKQAMEANFLIGIKSINRQKLWDNRFDSVPLLDIVKRIESSIQAIQPDTIFTHFRNDLNIDHRITYQATLTASRPIPNCSVKEIYSFEIPSSTEWNYPVTFSPNVFYDISDTIWTKIDAVKKYEGELRDWPHPRSLLGIQTLAEYWGVKSGLKFAEAFEAVRILR